ncbi:hypothetical protein SALBM311S_05490 [Streptomyces alboniger]
MTRSALCRVEGASPWPTRTDRAPSLSQPASMAAGVWPPAVARTTSASSCRGVQVGDDLDVPVGEVGVQFLFHRGKAVGVGAADHQPLQIGQRCHQERQGEAALRTGADDQCCPCTGGDQFTGQQGGYGGGAQGTDPGAVHHRDRQAGDVVVEGQRRVVVLVLAALVQAVLVGGLDSHDLAGAVTAQHRVGNGVVVAGLDGELARIVRQSVRQRAIGAFDGGEHVGEGDVDTGQVAGGKDPQSAVGGCLGHGLLQSGRQGVSLRTLRGRPGRIRARRPPYRVGSCGRARAPKHA